MPPETEPATEVQPPTAADDRRVGVPLRIVAVIAALVLAFFAAAIIAGATDNTSLPTCHDVNHGQARPSSNGDCFDGSSRRADAGLVAAIAGGICAAAALVLSVILAATGRRAQLFLILFVASLVFIGLEIAVIHL
jgi:hypothetical protein